MSVSGVKWDTVVPMPVVKGSFDLVRGNGGDDGPWRFCVVSLTRGMLVERSVVNNSSRTTVRLRGDDHSTTPCDRVIDRNLLQDTKADVSVKAFFNG